MKSLLTSFGPSQSPRTAAVRWLSGLLLALLPLLGWGQSTTVVISQIYGGGGNTSATYKNDFVELHNVSSSAVSIAGYVLQYASSAAAFAAPSATNSVTLAGSIPAGGYYLVGLASNGTPGSVLPTPDQSNTGLNLSATAGKVVLAADNSTAGITPTSANTVDYVGFGTAASAFEGTGPAPIGTATGNTFSFVRGNSGCTDTNQNSADFTTSSPPTARNSATAVFSCVTATASLSASALANCTYVVGSGPSASQSYNLTGSNLTAGTITITGSTDYAVSTDNSSFGNTASFTVAAGTLASTPVYVRLKAGLSVGNYNGESITNVGGGASVTVMANGSVTAQPALAANPTFLTGFAATQGAASPAQTYLLTGTTLGSAVTVTAPAGYEIAQGTPTTPGTYAATQSVTQANATAGRTIYVRLAAATSAGTYGTPGAPVNVTNTATGATQLNVPVDGTVTAPAPVLTATGTLTAFNALAGQASAAQTYNLTGVNLTGTVSIVAPTGYELSAVYANASTSGGYFASLTGITAAQVAGSGATISVRLAAGLATDPSSTPSGNVANSGGGTSGSQNVAVTGTVVGEPAAAPAPTVAAGTTTPTTVPLTLGAGAGTNLLVVVRPSASTATAPTDGTSYTAGTTYGTGTALGAGRVVFAAANATSVTVTGLSGSTSYVADVYSYNVGTAAGFENYLPAGGSSAVFTTPVQPPAAPGVLALEDDLDYPAATQLANSQTTASPTTGWYQNGTTVSSLITTATGNLSSNTYQYPTGVLAATPAGTSTQVSLATSGQDVYKTFAQPTGAVATYAAVLLKVTSAQGGDYFMHFISAAAPSSATNFRGRVYVRTVSSTTFNFGLTMGNETPVNYGTTAYTIGATYLVVLKYENSAATAGIDAATLFVVDPTAVATAEPTPAVGPINTGAAALQTTLNAFGLRQGTAGVAPTVTIDAIRVASGWGTAVGRPTYTSAGATIGAGNYYDVTLNNADVLTPVGAVNLEGALALTSGKINTSAANSLRLYAGASITGSSSTSFVNGPLTRETAAGAATTAFPVGKGTFYRPLTLTSTAQTAASTYTAEQVEGNPSRTLAAGNGLGTAPLARVSSKRYYTVTSSNTTPGNFTGTIALSFGAEDYVNVPSSPDFVIAKRDATGAFATQWINLGRSANTGPDSGAGGPSVAGTLTSATFSNFSDFVLGAQNDLSNTNVLAATNPLPVELTAFSAQRQADKAVAVKWATATEKNSARFEVQRSLDGREFATIATVAGQGSSAQPTAYATSDQAAPAALLYYRLRQVDLDGTSALSPVVTVAATGAGAAAVAKVQLYPNPAHSRISFIAATATPYRVLNQLGQPLLRGTAEAGTASINVEALPTGLYVLELQTATGRTVQKFEKD